MILTSQCYYILNVGTTYGGSENYKLTFSKYVNLMAGINKLSILSVAVGLPVSFFSFCWGSEGTTQCL